MALMSEKILMSMTRLCPGSAFGAFCVFITLVMLAYGLLIEAPWLRLVVSGFLFMPVVILLWIYSCKSYLLKSSHHMTLNLGYPI